MEVNSLPRFLNYDEEGKVYPEVIEDAKLHIEAVTIFVQELEPNILEFI